jgi:hypothetical protein
MNSAPAELLPLLTSAALQPSTWSPSVAGAALRYKSCCDVLRVVGRVLSSMDLRRSHITVFVFKEKTAQPEPNQARRLFKNGGGLVHIFVNLYPVSRSFCVARAFKNQPIYKHAFSIS